jgi:hypothetical protein
MVMDPGHDRKRDHYEMPLAVAKQIIEIDPAFRCPVCKEINYSGKPPGGFMGDFLNLTALAEMVKLNVVCSVTRIPLRDHFRSLLGIKVCGYYIDTVLKQAGRALGPICLELLTEVKSQPVVQSDETVFRSRARVM